MRPSAKRAPPIGMERSEGDGIESDSNSDLILHYGGGTRLNSRGGNSTPAPNKETNYVPFDQLLSSPPISASHQSTVPNMFSVFQNQDSPRSPSGNTLVSCNFYFKIYEKQTFYFKSN